MLSLAKLLRQANGHLPHHPTTANSAVDSAQKPNTEVNKQCVALLAREKTVILGVPFAQSLSVQSLSANFLSTNPLSAQCYCNLQDDLWSLIAGLHPTQAKRKAARVRARNWNSKQQPSRLRASSKTFSTARSLHKSAHPHRAQRLDLPFPTLRFTVVPGSSPTHCRRNPCRLPVPFSHASYRR